MLEFPRINRNKIGCLNELRVCADLLGRGFDVFRAVSHSCRCDIIATTDAGAWRIEVRTGHKSASGYVSYPRTKFGKYDILAIVLNGGKILYRPELPDIA